jgi:hypothetical protein
MDWFIIVQIVSVFLILLLLYLVFRLYVGLDAQKNEVTKLVREIAIREAKTKESKKKK